MTYSIDTTGLAEAIDAVSLGIPFREVIIGSSLPKAIGQHFGIFWGREVPTRARPILFVHDGLANLVQEGVGALMEKDAATGVPTSPKGYGDLIRVIVLQDVDQRFNTAPRGNSGGTVHGGETWAPLSDGYIKKRPERERGQLLRDTGELQQSFTSNGQIYEVF